MKSATRSFLPVLPSETAAAPSPAAAAAASDNIRISLVTLGCDKNTVDSERVQARLASAGAQLGGAPEDADVIVVNTCGFIEAAKEESIEALLDAVRLKQGGRVQAVVAMGCLVQRYEEELREELPEVDLFISLTQIEQLVPSLRARGLLAPVTNMQQPLRRLSTATRYTSYLKVSEGCDHTCAFCAIPLMRGKHRSTPIEQLIGEAQELERSGIVELNLISQDTTWYGRDLVRGLAGATQSFSGRTFKGMKGITQVETLARTEVADEYAGRRHGLLDDLLESLARETAIPWLRLFYMYPSGVSRELVELMAREPRILPYLDLPIQHGSDRILEKMRRPERRATILERVGWLRDAVPDLSLRTTVIVGFPGETDDDFNAMLDLLEQVRFDYLGAFPYSIEEDTPAATMSDQVPDWLKRERLEELLERQAAITQEKNEVRVGSVVPVLIDRLTGRDSQLKNVSTDRGAVARTRGQALEVDGVVHIADAAGVKPGTFAMAKLTGTVDSDFRGEVVGQSDGTGS
ncbi:MAG: 30S ribosomal protein S12 methylthiotransferase RimO [Gemmatimonadota bacterium]